MIFTLLLNFYHHYKHLIQLKRIWLISSVLVFFSFNPLVLFAQNSSNNTLQLFHIVDQSQHLRKEALDTRGARMDELPAITLPFWDDFSEKKDNNAPLQDYWEDNTGVLIEQGIGINAPSLDVASFDGADLEGNASRDQQSSERSDQLTSRRIDLTTVDTALQNTIYLSFFYQFAGYGEQPDAFDKFVLEFKDDNGQWENVWEVDIASSPDLSRNDFTQVIILVDPQKYIHDDFQFQFANFNSRNGAFDTWNLDYVFMNAGRNETDLQYKDRVVSNWINGILTQYTGVPYDQFQSPLFDLSSELRSSTVEINNLGEDIVTSNYTSRLVDQANPKVSLVSLANNEGFGTLLRGLERRPISVDMTDTPTLRAAVTKPMTLSQVFYFNKIDLGLVKTIENGSEVYYANINYAKNDTIRRKIHVQDFFAYDDGSAEYGAGINQTNGQLVVEYDVPLEDEITAIDISFPAITKDFTAIPIDITILSALDNEASSVLYKDTAVIDAPTKKNEFQRFLLYRPVTIQGKIYVGFTQFSNVNLAVGLDKNTNAKDRIYYNVLGNWEQNTLIEGSLMIRPVLGERVVATSISNNMEPNQQPFFYPNPVSNNIQFSTPVDQVIFYNLTGQALQTFSNIDQNINGDFLNSGTYIIEIQVNNRVNKMQLIKK